MPTYDYACPKCETTFEVFHGMNDRPRIACPSCRGRARKQIGAGAGILFRGSGFYQTDYRSGTYQAAAKADQAAPSSPSTSSPTPSSPTPTPAAKD
jgi:putative FmdB family regulatory protein